MKILGRAKMILWTICLLSVALCAGFGNVPLWSRSSFVVSRHDKDSLFYLRTIRQDGLHLTGICTYSQDPSAKQTVVIQGTDAKDGGFWPDVTSQVQNDSTGEWKTVATPFNHGHRATVTVKPGEANQDLFVSLDIFLPLIGKHKLGRILLGTGDSTVFELRLLLEQEDE